MDFEQAKRFIKYLPIDIQESEHNLIKVTIDETIYFVDKRTLDLVIHVATRMYSHGYQNGSEYTIKVVS